LYRVRKQIEIDKVHEQGITGAGITVAVLDTGIVKHLDFDDRILAFHDFVNRKKNVYDDSSHGTHICGIVAGSGKNSRGRIKGIAPKCNLIVGKVLDRKGEGDFENMLYGIQWVIENKERYNIKVLNISIGIGALKEKELESAAISAVELAWSSGLVVVVAAGNNGPKPMSISPIGASDKVITVGCHEGGVLGEIKSLCQRYSGRGPSKYAIKKPDIVAPGTNIMSCSENGYSVKSGTSMSAPIVSGVCALLLEKYPNITNEEIKRKIMYSAKDLNENWEVQGWGMINGRMLLE